MGVGRFVLLEPNVVKLYMELPPPSLEDHRSHLARVMDEVEERGLHAQLRLAGAPPRSPRRSARRRTSRPRSSASTSSTCEAGDTRERMFGASFDIGTTTCVCTLVDLRNGATAAVASTINHQASFGADVMARAAKAMRGPEDIEQLQRAVLETVNGSCSSASRPKPTSARGDLRERGRGQRHDAVAPHRGEPRVDRGGARTWRPSPSRSTCGPIRSASRCTRSGGSRSTRRSARTWAPTSWPTSSRRGSSAIRRRGSWSTSARTARSRAATPTAPSPPRPRRARVRGRRDPLRDARHRGRDRGGGPHERRRGAPGDRRRRRAPGDLRLRAHRHRGAAAARRGCSTTAAR